MPMSLTEHLMLHSGSARARAIAFTPLIPSDLVCSYCTAGSNQVAVIPPITPDRCGTPPGCHIETACDFCRHVQRVCHTELISLLGGAHVVRACSDIPDCRARSHRRHHVGLGLAGFDLECELCTGGTSLMSSYFLLERQFDIPPYVQSRSPAS
jgi:hypothetical protein